MTPLSASEFAREARRKAEAQTGGITQPAPPAPPRERQRTPAPAKEEEKPARFVRPVTPPPDTIKVLLPGDGSPDEVRAYFNRTYGMKPHNSTAERARRLCAKVAKAAEGVTVEAYDWRKQQDDWKAIRIAEEEAHG